MNSQNHHHHQIRPLHQVTVTALLPVQVQVQAHTALPPHPLHGGHGVPKKRRRKKTRRRRKGRNGNTRRKRNIRRRGSIRRKRNTGHNLRRER